MPGNGLGVFLSELNGIFSSGLHLLVVFYGAVIFQWYFMGMVIFRWYRTNFPKKREGWVTCGPFSWVVGIEEKYRGWMSAAKLNIK